VLTNKSNPTTAKTEPGIRLRRLLKVGVGIKFRSRALDGGR
jgi:hypothetical protein